MSRLVISVSVLLNIPTFLKRPPDLASNGITGQVFRNGHRSSVTLHAGRESRVARYFVSAAMLSLARAFRQPRCCRDTSEPSAKSWLSRWTASTAFIPFPPGPQINIKLGRVRPVETHPTLVNAQPGRSTDPRDEGLDTSRPRYPQSVSKLDLEPSDLVPSLSAHGTTALGNTPRKPTKSLPPLHSGNGVEKKAAHESSFPNAQRPTQIWRSWSSGNLALSIKPAGMRLSNLKKYPSGILWADVEEWGYPRNKRLCAMGHLQTPMSGVIMITTSCSISNTVALVSQASFVYAVICELPPRGIRSHHGSIKQTGSSDAITYCLKSEFYKYGRSFAIMKLTGPYLPPGDIVQLLARIDCFVLGASPDIDDPSPVALHVLGYGPGTTTARGLPIKFWADPFRRGIPPINPWFRTLAASMPEDVVRYFGRRDEEEANTGRWQSSDWNRDPRTCTPRSQCSQAKLNLPTPGKVKQSAVSTPSGRMVMDLATRRSHSGHHTTARPLRTIKRPIVPLIRPNSSGVQMANYSRSGSWRYETATAPVMASPSEIQVGSDELPPVENEVPSARVNEDEASLLAYGLTVEPGVSFQADRLPIDE